MNCQECRKWLSPYMDSELDAATTFQISQHLEACERCGRNFSLERQAETSIAKRLKRFDPYVDWNHLERRILRRRRVFPGQRMWHWAAAACVAFAFLGLSQWPTPTLADNPAQWAVEELHRLSPNCEAFEANASCNTDMNTMATQVLGQTFAIELVGSELHHQPFSIVDVTTKICPTGKKRIQVRLNCCGHPILLTVGRCGHMGELTPVDRVFDERKTQYLEYTLNAYGKDLRIASRKVGDFVVLAVGPHNTGEIVKRVVFTESHP